MWYPTQQQHTSQSTSQATSPRRATRAALLSLSLVLAGCAELGLPTQPVRYVDDTSLDGTACGARARSRTEVPDDRPGERSAKASRCTGTMRGGGGRPAAPRR